MHKKCHVNFFKNLNIFFLYIGLKKEQSTFNFQSTIHTYVTIMRHFLCKKKDACPEKSKACKTFSELLKSIVCGHDYSVIKERQKLLIEEMIEKREKRKEKRKNAEYVK